MSSPLGLRALVILCISAALAPAARAQSNSIAEVADCATRNLPPSAHAHAKLATRAASGAQRTIDVDYWSRTGAEGTRKIVIADHAAAQNAASAYLFSDGDAIGEAWIYTKQDVTAKRIETRGPDAKLFGSNVSLEDFARFARVVFPGQVRRLADAEISGRKVYVIETKPAPDAGSEYVRILTSIDKDWCVILRRESFDLSYSDGGKARKVYSVAPADVKLSGKFANASRARLEDAKDGSSTEMEIVELEVPAKVDDSFFTPEALPRVAPH